ncbi:hypothetical protein OM076_36385 [Solirubrobacter ginsenosidimutans]|uniref:Uncharacterized protein n=1 Tax=Solirubrobacter ginsenosidimutans TaxID=490573 RepID=A0A9X3N315_9ACTN|nr:hypothetical protein [Solirubrobacter ginsenosidimutans]MDA0165802.1 hypothetical protein [Solirubrobacter ginsenosidimutans]
MQWEFAGPLGPPPGRYVARRFAGDQVREVVVVTEAEAPRRRRRRAAAEDAIPVRRVTVIDASAAGDPDDEDWQRRAGACLARFLSAHRVASAEPGAPDPGRASLMRAGTGTGAELAIGEWTEAHELPLLEPQRVRRRSKHRPGERLAALLSARDVSLACEELTLRSRADLECGRHPEAALQLEAALSTAVAELAGWVTHGDLAERLEELRGYLDPVRAAAAAAREGRLQPAGVEVVTAALARLEAAIRARALHAAE